MSDVVKRIHDFNEGRIPDLVKDKFRKMSKNAFSFFRGTCHLFYPSTDEDGQWSGPVGGPDVFICGDLHTENFGAFRTDSDDVIFGINDFDEATIAPALWDVARCATSIVLAAEDEWSTSGHRVDGEALAKRFLDAYRATVGRFCRTGRIGVVHKSTAPPPVREVIDDAIANTKAPMKHDGARFTQEEKIIRLGKSEDAVRDVIAAALADGTPAAASFFRVLDVVQRVSGNGSRGVENYAVLVQGDGSADATVVLEVKEQPDRTASAFLRPGMSGITPRAAAVVRSQRAMQMPTPFLLGWIRLDLPKTKALDLPDRTKSFRVQQLTATEAKLDADRVAGDEIVIGEVVETLGRVTAWAHARSADLPGLAGCADLAAFVESKTSAFDAVLAAAAHTAGTVRSDFEKFRASV